MSPKSAGKVLAHPPGYHRQPTLKISMSMTTKNLSERTCASKPKPNALRSGSKKNAAVSVSPRAKRPLNGKSASALSKRGSKAAGSQEDFTWRRLKESSRRQNKVSVEFTADEWADIRKCARADGKPPAEWLKASALSWVPETLESIRREGLSEAERSQEAAGIAQKLGAVMSPTSLVGLSFTDDERRAITLCALWEGIDFGTLCRASIFAFIESSFSEMERCAEPVGRAGNITPTERAWAAKIYVEATPTLARLGWDGDSFTPSPASLPDRPFDENDDSRRHCDADAINWRDLLIQTLNLKPVPGTSQITDSQIASSLPSR